MTQALEGLRVLDLTRVLAGPTATQILGDLGARVIKIERPGVGDDTRSYGPPFLKDRAGHATTESAYYLALNRNKESVVLDIAQTDGQEHLHRLLEKTDILVENFKVGGLAKYGFSYDQLKTRYPRLIYCSITGFGQTGPLSTEPGYDFIAQGMSGFMAATGAQGSPPTKAGVAIGDYVTGLYATIAILAALQARTHTGRGQHIDLSLLDCTLALMTHVAQDYLTSGVVPPKIGNAHAAIVPYQDFPTADGHVIIAAGNDHLFRVLCRVLGHDHWGDDPRFVTNTARVENRQALLDLMQPILATEPTAYWVHVLREADVPVGPIYTVAEAFKDPQVVARDMCTHLHHTGTDQDIPLLASPLKLSDTPVTYRSAPPTMGEQTAPVLREIQKKNLSS